MILFTPVQELFWNLVFFVTFNNIIHNEKYSEITFVLIFTMRVIIQCCADIYDLMFFSLQWSFKKEIINIIQNQISSKLMEIHITISGSVYICYLFRIILPRTVLSGDLC